MAEDSQDAQFEEYKQQQRENFSERNGESVIHDDVYQALGEDETRANSTVDGHGLSLSCPNEGVCIWRRLTTLVSNGCSFLLKKVYSLWDFVCLRFAELTTPESVALVLLMAFLISACFFSIFAMF
ncbi:hypothetical protein BEWA_044880 [Theileria equi strain WA]|uniref:Uncharacterized protein n=1 Tax=Theileria equi strain WA TaxID=1537102 RepID=L1LH01_THEEQ|nr:hypothetical protein BEWA_044880 [Theileria equi strain WA]EKX74408.1 hypothetical protein BEWA_044880 [Theileria equi strain WA]|eukprot:XP_004833860.1 hypothetical protein BEWA_044880 [Theileria equi strain WA]